MVNPIKEDLKSFYNKYAKKYHQTRKKRWPEGDIVVQEILNSKRSKISILEFGCGSGRFINHLNKTFAKNKIDYIGVDISANLIKLAQQDNPNSKFICADISQYIIKVKQESFDFIIGTESFQHIPDSKERFFLMKNFYRTLKYDGKIIMTNRCLSYRFIRKYRKNIIRSLLQFIISFGKKGLRDIFVPRQGDNGEELRFYHILRLKELENIAKISGFLIDKLGYIQKDNSISNKSKDAKTSIIVARKSVFIPKQ